MVENWIRKLAEQQLSREQEHTETADDEAATQRLFDAAAAPFWAQVQEELRRLVMSYNQAIGRDDLAVATGSALVYPNRPETLEIHRGSWVDAHCVVTLWGHGRQLTVDYAYTKRGTGERNEMCIGLTFDEQGVRAQRGNSSPAAVAKHILTTWAANFGDSPPQKPPLRGRA
jgi:hypothetical protein